MTDTSIVTKGVAKQIADKLRSEIFDGKLSPKEKLPTEADMAKYYGVSRPTVREALKRLSAQNLIHSKRGPGGGNFVNEISLEQVADTVTEASMMLTSLGSIPIEQVFSACYELEALCLRLAIQQSDPSLPQKLESVLNEESMPDVSDEAFCQFDVKFQRSIVDACGNIMIRLALYTVIEALIPITNMIITKTRSRGKILEFHKSIISSILKKDVTQSHTILSDLIDYRKKEYLKALK